MSDIFPYSMIDEVVLEYKEILLIERSAMVELTQSRAALESERTRAIYEAYERNEIDLKNADTRKTGENKAVENSNGVYWLERVVREAQQNYEQAEIDRKAIEAEISLTKAWLYSQSGLGK